MGRILILSLAITLGFAGIARATEIADLAWNEANIKTLRVMDKTACYRFITRDDPGDRVNDDSLYLECDWYPAGNGTYELAINSESGPDVSFLDVYWRDASGKITSQDLEIVGDASEDRYDGPQFAGLSHNGEYELVLFAALEYDSPPHRTKFIPNGDWPQVYRLHNGKYAEASRDFPGFYTKQILPQLDAAIAKTQTELQETPPGKASSSWGPDDSWHTQFDEAFGGADHGSRQNSARPWPRSVRRLILSTSMDGKSRSGSGG